MTACWSGFLVTRLAVFFIVVVLSGKFGARLQHSLLDHRLVVGFPLTIPEFEILGSKPLGSRQRLLEFTLCSLFNLFNNLTALAV